MPRPREFDPEDAIEEAMRVFWAKGFSESSYDDLVSGTGVSRKSLYTVFGDKHALFRTALQHYESTVIPSFVGALDAKNVTRDDIKAMFRSFVEFADTPYGHAGCFMARTAADVRIEDEKVKTIVADHLQDLHRRFCGALTRAGYLNDRADTLGHYFVGILQGFLAMAHAQAGRERIEPFIEEALTALD